MFGEYLAGFPQHWKFTLNHKNYFSTTLVEFFFFLVILSTRTEVVEIEYGNPAINGVCCSVLRV